MSCFQFNKIVVIESLGVEDRKTGQEVFGDLIKTEKQRRVEFVDQQVAKFEEDLNKFLLVDLFPENVNKISKLHNPWVL